MGPRLRLLALLALVAALFAAVSLSGSLDAQRVRDAVEPAGVWAPLLFIPVSALLTVAFFPGPLLAGASGLLFGTALGFPISLASAVLGGSAAFLLARRVGRDALEEVGGRRIRAAKAWVEARGFLAVFYARLAPGVPYNSVNYAAGLTRIPLTHFAAATAIGAAPRAFAYTALGGSIDDLGRPEALVAFGVLIAMALLGGLLAHRDWRRGRGHGGDDEPVTASGPGTGSSSPAGHSAAPP